MSDQTANEFDEKPVDQWGASELALGLRASASVERDVLTAEIMRAAAEKLVEGEHAESQQLPGEILDAIVALKHAAYAHGNWSPGEQALMDVVEKERMAEDRLQRAILNALQEALHA